MRLSEEESGDLGSGCGSWDAQGGSQFPAPVKGDYRDTEDRGGSFCKVGAPVRRNKTGGLEAPLADPLRPSSSTPQPPAISKGQTSPKAKGKRRASSRGGKQSSSQNRSRKV